MVGSHTCVYQGRVRGRPVAVKILCPEFSQQVCLVRIGFPQVNAQPKSDIYSFGMLAYEVFKQPYDDYPESGDYRYLPLTGLRPVRPLDNLKLSDKVWAICEQYWSQDIRLRPRIPSLRRLLLEIDLHSRPSLDELECV
ncbi:hypothetical protein NEOLEDRAFT_1184529 [Neolentinus lepideus HHB14362 ss-1]|uniref:Serine-threonine/tyrosine-protein kinase catalytic domain-containing protein n=1 Tax=Neolentinus lepideus HHB14362 ss-1 TaxID=1314782 RepID=A0A165MCL0_9AGAM|nr:hypothetical protein NEOLEDRAFT_1184529 [Neolentinus lepideus HHB14362 ss-1]